MSILKMVPAIFFAIGVSIAIINVDGSAIELLYTNDYTYLRVASNFVYIKLKSEGSAKISLTDTPFSSSLEASTPRSYPQPNRPYYSRFSTRAPMRQSSTQFLYQFSLHDSTNDNSKSQFAVNGQVKAEVETPGIFSNAFNEDKFVEILIYWNSDYLIMSRIGDQFPLFHWKDQSSNLQSSIKYIGIHIDSQRDIYGISSILKNQWEINFLPLLNTSYAFGETVTKPTLEDKEHLTRTPELSSSLMLEPILDELQSLPQPILDELQSLPQPIPDLPSLNEPILELPSRNEPTHEELLPEE